MPVLNPNRGLNNKAQGREPCERTLGYRGMKAANPTGVQSLVPAHPLTRIMGLDLPISVHRSSALVFYYSLRRGEKTDFPNVWKRHRK